MAKPHYERLAPLDGAFLELETPGASMHVGLTGIFDATPLRGGAGLDFDTIRRAVAAALPHIPRYRQKLRFTPLERHAVWVDDEHFSIDDHVRHAAVPSPGSEAQLCETVARIVERPLDRRKPLWEIWVVEGLEKNRFALMAKVHHCMIDGVSGVELMGRLLSPQPTAEIPGAAPFEPRPAPSPSALGFDDSLRRMGMQWRAWRGLTERVFGWGVSPEASSERALERAAPGPRPSMTGHALRSVLRPATATSFNRPIGPQRRLDRLTVDLGEVLRIREGLGGSLNDVVLATVAGAVREQLAAQGEDPARFEFRVLAPVDVRTRDERGALGNRISAWIVQLPLSEADPGRRLTAIREQTQRLKQSNVARATDVLTQVGDWLTPRVVGIGARNVTKLRPFNMVVTNIPGPPIPLYLSDARLLEGFPIVPLTDNLGLGIALLSYDGQLHWGFNADYDLVRDLGPFVERVATAFDELRRAATRAHGAKAPRPDGPHSQ